MDDEGLCHDLPLQSGDLLFKAVEPRFSLVVALQRATQELIQEPLVRHACFGRFGPQYVQIGFINIYRDFDRSGCRHLSTNLLGPLGIDFKLAHFGLNVSFSFLFPSQINAAAISSFFQ
jgi:hypothetical protein